MGVPVIQDRPTEKDWNEALLNRKLS
jgi:hypothetical protein